MSEIENLFRNDCGNNTLRITLDNGIDLYYHLFDNPVQHCWQDYWQNILIEKSSIDSEFANQELASYIDQLNNYHLRLGFDKITNRPSRELLNELHNRFVEDKDNPDWDTVNRLIHKIENNLVIDWNSQIKFYCGQIKPWVPIQPYHKLFLSTEFSNWGTLYLGYETIGKDWADIAIDDDTGKDLAVQDTIGTETVMSFQTQAPYEKLIENQFYKWYMKNDSFMNIPIDNLNKLSLGRYLLGKVIVTEAFLDYEKNPLVWYMPNHNIKQKWNKDILSKANSISKLEFFNSTMFYDTLVKHTT